LDFIKLIGSDLRQLEPYLFKQRNKVEVVVYLEEILLSVNHKEFNLGMSEFSKPFNYRKTEALVTSLISKYFEEGREFFKIQLSDKMYVKNLIESYLVLVKLCRDIQRRLIPEYPDNVFYPICIVCSSYIIERLTTRFLGLSGEPLPEFEIPNINDGVQVKNLIVDMVALTNREDTNIPLSHMLPKIKDYELRTFLKEQLEGDVGVGDKLIESIKVINLYDNIIEYGNSKEINNWLEGKMACIKLPYFNAVSRDVRRDWDYKYLAMPNRK